MLLDMASESIDKGVYPFELFEAANQLVWLYRAYLTLLREIRNLRADNNALRKDAL